MINKVILIGRVGSDPESKVLESNNIVANFSLATSDKYKNKKGEVVDQTEWHRIVLWGKLAEITEKYVKKGDLLYIEGKITTRSWDDKGIKKYSTEIVAHILKMLSGKTKKDESENNTSIMGYEAKPVNESDDDLPFN